MTEASIDKQVAMTILEQIDKSYSGTIVFSGGESRKISALRLMGAEGFNYTQASVKFKVKGAKDFNTVVVRLNAGDFYDVELWNCHVLEQEPFIVRDLVDQYNDVSAFELGNLLVKEVLYK